MTGIFNKQPSITKYVSIWDVEGVLDFIRGMPESKLFSDKMITLKLTMLLALTTASRSSKVAKLSIKGFEKLPAVYIEGLTKVSCEKSRVFILFFVVILKRVVSYETVSLFLFLNGAR